MLRRHYSNSTITCSNNNNNNNNNTLNNTSNNKNPNQKLQHQQQRRSIERTRSESTTTATTASRTTRSTSTSSPCSSSSDSSTTCTFETNLLSCETTTTTKSNNAFDTAITTNNTTTNNSTIDSNIHIDNRSENNRTMRNRSFLLPSSYHTKTSSSTATATTIPGKRNNTNMSSTTATTTTSISDHEDQQQKQKQQQQQQLYYSDHPAYYNNNNNKHNKMNKNSFMVPSIPDDADVAAGQKLLLYEQYNNNNSNNNNNKNNTNVVIDTNDYFPYHNNNNNSTNDALSDTSGELRRPFLIDSAPSSTDTINTINTIKGHPTELEFFEDLITDPVLVLGIDITHMNKNTQFIVCATGVFCFSLLYGYLQELLSVELCSRQLGLFLAVVQFTGYTSLAYVLRNFVYEKTKKRNAAANELRRINSNVSTLSLDENSTHAKIQMNNNNNNEKDGTNNGFVRTPSVVPLKLYLGLSLLRAVDLAMTNLAMQYINYPAKTLMKSSRIVFTMLFGVLIQRKKYKTIDYVIVAAMVGGLALFMHADANSDAVFHHMGVIMLTVSLICDGAISNMSESIMSTFGIGQDEFIFRMYSIALLAITAAAGVKGDLKDGLYWMTQPGTYAQYVSNAPIEERTWSVGGKVLTMVLFSSMGFFGSSCSAAITKNFGALTMSITSTARKATTLFLSFFLFNNVCTTEHIAGIVLFISALTTKSLRRRNKDGFGSSNKKQTSTNVNIKGHHSISQHNNKVHPTININKPSNTSSSSSNTNSSGIMGSLIEVIRPNRVTRRTFSERRGDKNNKNNNNNTKSAPLPSSNNNMHTSLLHVV